MEKRTINLFPKQDDFFSCPDRFSAFIGGVGSGKTYVGAVKALYHASKPKTLGLVIAPTYPMMKDATLRTFLALAEGAIGYYNRSENVVAIRGGGEILFRSADNPDRLRGPNAHWAWLDEASLCPQQTWDIVIGRLRADGKAGPCWVTTTPKGRNWLYERTGEMTMFKVATKENPYLAPEFVASLERAYTGAFARQELYGEFVTYEGLVYSAFDRNIHVQKRAENDFAQRLLGLDEGYVNPAVILDIGVDNDGRAHIFREWYARGKLQAEVVAEAKRMYNQAKSERVIVDASAAGLIADLRNEGILAEPREGRVLDGIAIILNALAAAKDGRPRLTIDPSCVNTIAEFEAYMWKPERDEPLKQSDHAMDALRYVMQTISGSYDPAKMVDWI